MNEEITGEAEFLRKWHSEYRDPRLFGGQYASPPVTPKATASDLSMDWPEEREVPEAEGEVGKDEDERAGQ